MKCLLHLFIEVQLRVLPQRGFGLQLLVEPIPTLELEECQILLR